MIRSLIVQLSTQSKVVPHELQSLHSSGAGGSQRPSIEALMKILRGLIDNFDKTFIVLDALDECKERVGLLECIDELVSWKIDKICIRLRRVVKRRRLKIHLNVLSSPRIRIRSIQP
jgi:hypothetical protein